MRSPLALAGALLAGLTLAVVVPAGAAQAALACAPDSYEIDDSGTSGMAIVAGATEHRAICQSRDPLPGKTWAQDIDFFEFTAVEGQAYSAELVDLGAQVGGMHLGISAVGPDGRLNSVDGVSSQNWQRFTTRPLTAGTYRIGTSTSELEIYPEDNVITTKTIQGDAGIYGVHLATSSPAPVLSALRVSPNPVKGGDKAKATFTFDRPTPTGGMLVVLHSSDGFTATSDGTPYVPGGVTTFTMGILTKRVSRDTPVTFTGQVEWNGPEISSVLTVRK